MDFEIAIERIIGGLEKRTELTASEQRQVAIHECGHGVVSWFIPEADPLLKLTIIPRTKGALGFAQYLPKEEGLQTKEELLSKIITILSGRAAELEFCSDISSGASDDF